MLPLIKVFSLVVRILARPVIAGTKKYTSQKLKHEHLRAFFIWAGNRSHRVNVIINRKFLQLNNENFKVQDLSEVAALDLGVETFYEVIIYAIILGLPLLEMYKAYTEGLEKSEKQKELMDSIQNRLTQLDDENQKQTQQLEKLTLVNSILHRKSTVLENVLVAQKVLQQENPILSQIEELNRSLIQGIQSQVLPQYQI